MTMNTSSADLDFAVAVIAEAGDFTLKHFRSADLQIITKADGSPVTAADEGAEQLIRQRIQENFPEDGITGEEGNDVVEPAAGAGSSTRSTAPMRSLAASRPTQTCSTLKTATGPALGSSTFQQ